MRQVAVVTGAGSGIGRQVCLSLLDDGYRLVLAGRRRQALEATVSASGAEPGSTLVVPSDVTRPESVRALFAQAKDRFGRIDLLFNNAGTFGAGRPLDEIPYDEWQTVLATNLTGAFLCAQEAFRAMKDQVPAGGRIINNGSLAAAVPRPYAVAYTATKHAITGLTKSIALEGRRYGVACGQIDIGNAATEMTAAMPHGVPQADGTLRPEPIMDVAHAASAVRYMASLPLDANVQFLTVMATTMPFIGRG